MYLMQRSSILLLIAVWMMACSGPDPVSRKPAKPESVEIATTEAIPTTDETAAQVEAPLDLPEPTEERFTVAVISDLNSSYGSTRYRDDVHAGVDWIIEDLKPDLVLCAGDMVAGQRRGLNYRGMWEAFHVAVTDRFEAAGIPFAITPGNHDGARASRYKKERDEFLVQWADRKPDLEFVDDTHWPLRYAFRHGETLFISLDATLPGRLDGDQTEWLAETLAKHEGPKIVFGHVPLYPFSKGKQQEILDDPELETLMRSEGVSMFITGHHHVYYPGRRGDLKLISAPLLGNGPRKLVGSDVRSTRGVMVLEIERDKVNYQVHTAPKFDTLLDPRSLPEVLNPRNARHRMARDGTEPVVASADR